MDNTTALGAGSEYSPGKLLDVLRENLRLESDAALSRLLDVDPSFISKIRRRRIPMSGALLIRMHEATGLDIIDLRYMMGDRRSKFRASAVQGRPRLAKVPSATWPWPAPVRSASNC